MGDAQTAYKVVVGLNPGTRTGTENGASIDCSGFDEAIIIAAAGGITATGTWDLKLQHDTVTGMGTVTDVASAVIPQFVNASQNTIKTGRIRLEAGIKQFLRINSVQATAAVAGGVIVMLLRGVASGMHDTPSFDL